MPAKTVSFLCAASAVAILATTPTVADARDGTFPKAPVTTERMQACPEYGKGFFKMPGSDTCVQVGGQIRGETGVRSNGGRRSDAIDWRTQGTISLDARDPTSDGRVMIRMRGINSSN